MSLDQLALAAEVFGAIAIVVTLVLLNLQLRQSTSATRANTVAGITESISYYILVSAESDKLAAIWAKAEEHGFESLSAAEELQLRGFNAALFNSFQNAYDQMKLGTLTLDQWEPYRKMLTALLAQRPNEEFWDRYRNFYPQPFVQEVERR